MARKARILVIEDDLGLRASLCALFRRARYDPLGVSSPEGLRLLRKGLDVDLIVADLWDGPPEGRALLRLLDRTGRRGMLLRLSDPRGGGGGEEEREEDLSVTDNILHRGRLLDQVARMLE
ncbi:MAG: hypothetical protein JW958_05825 [Candidatus Eisenbacteria bacterium]|nr:hypothetical protein [Candidatus Eisenbacteria bacterium]